MAGGGRRSDVYRWVVPNLPAPPAGTPGWGSPRRWAVFTFGYICLIVGIAMGITAELGVGSWQVLETGLVELTGASFGVVATVEAVVALTIAWVWLNQPPWIATGLLAIGGMAIGALIDVMDTPEGLVVRIALFAVALLLMAVGVAFYLASDLGASAQDAIFVGIYRTYALRPGAVRFVMDGVLVLAGVVIGGQFGVGTLAMTVGLPAMIDPALRLGHRLADTPLPTGLVIAAQPLAGPEDIQREDPPGPAADGAPRPQPCHHD